MVASIDANETQADNQLSEFAGAIAVTTKSFATARGLKVVGRLNDVDAVLTAAKQNKAQENGVPQTGSRQSEQVLRHLQNPPSDQWTRTRRRPRTAFMLATR